VHVRAASGGFPDEPPHLVTSLMVRNFIAGLDFRSYPQTQEGVLFPNYLHVYARRPVASLAIAAPAIRIDPLVALIGRDELRGAAQQPQ
jgi:hypothetical protein